MENPFERIENRLGNVESLLNRLIENAKPVNPTLPEIGGVELAMEITGLKRPTIYGLTSARGIPHYRQGKKLRFKRSELIQWIESGRKLSGAEVALHAAQLPSKTYKAKSKGRS